MDNQNLVNANGDNLEQNLIQIYNPERKVHNLTWDQFAQKFEEKGWANAKNDNTVRGLFNLCDGLEDHKGLQEMAKFILDLQEPNPELKNAYEAGIATTVRDLFLLKAQNKQPFNFNEVQRSSVLHFQKYLNENQNEHFDFNRDMPAEEANINEIPQNNNNNEINPLNNNNNNEINQQNNNNIEINQLNNNIQQVQENQNVNVVPENNNPQVQQPVEQKRIPLDEAVINTRSNKVAAELKDNTLTLRGSDEYKNAREEFYKVQKHWKDALDACAGKIENLRETEARQLKTELLNVLHLDDKYIGKKLQENDKSTNAKKRVASVQDSFDLVEEQLFALNGHLKEIAKQPAPSFEELSTDFDASLKAINGAKLTLRGSKEFDTAAEEFEKLNKKMQALKEKYAGNENLITTAELDDLYKHLYNADYLVSDYLAVKTGNTVNENSHNRVNAMNKAATGIVQAIHRCRQLKEEKQAAPAQDINTLSGSSAKNYLAIEAAEKDVHFGSDEYKNAKSSFKDFNEKLMELAAPNHQITARELNDLNRMMEKASGEIDKYLNTKFDKELSAKTQKRVDAMRQAKETILETKKKYEVLTKERRAQYQNIPSDTLVNEETTVASDLTLAQTHVNGSRVYFGGKDYDAAAEAYTKVMNNEMGRDNARKAEAPSKNSLQEEVKELREARAKTLVYIERKEKEIKELDAKGKRLDAKGTERLKQMRNAFDTINRRIDIAEGKLETINAKDKAETEKKAAETVNEKELAISGKKGLDKIIAMNVRDAVVNLQTISKRGVVRPSDMATIRYSAAVLFLAETIKNKSFKGTIPATMDGFGRAATQIGNSPEFKGTLPNKLLNVDMCNRLLTNPNTMKKMMQSFEYNIRQTAGKSQVKGLMNQRKLQEEAFKKDAPAVNQPHK